MLFQQLVTAWVLCTTRRTVSGLLPFIPAAERWAYDAYHRFQSHAVWEPALLIDALLRVLARTAALVYWLYILAAIGFNSLLEGDLLESSSRADTQLL